MSFKAFSYSSLPSFQLKVNKGLKEISSIENSFSFFGKASHAPSFLFALFHLPVFFCLVESVVLRKRVFHCLQPQTHRFLTKISLGWGAVEWQIHVSKPNNFT